MRRIIISVLILTKSGAMASAAPNITLTLNTTMDDGNATVTSITNAGLFFQPLQACGKPLYSYLVSYKNPRMTYTVGDGLTDRTPLNKGQGYWLFMNTLTETNKDSLVWAGKPWLPN